MTASKKLLQTESPLIRFVVRNTQQIRTYTPFFAIQIIKYLTAHAHPQMRKNVSGSVETLWHRRIKDRSQNPMVPVTVQDQIRLWELERNRLKSQEGMLYKIRY